MLIFFNRTVTWQPPPGPGAAWIPGRRYWSGPSQVSHWARQFLLVVDSDRESESERTQSQRHTSH